MDAFRYSADFLAQVPYIESSSVSARTKMPSHYGGWGVDDDLEWRDMPPGMRPSKFSKLRNKKPEEIYNLQNLL
jgi:hypothetical protein